MEKDIDNFEEAIVYHELADSITNAMEELNSRELIASLQKKYENEKLRNDNLQMKVRYTNFILWGTIAFLFVVACMCYYYYYKNRNNKKKIAEIELQIQENEEEIERYQQEIEDIQISKDQVLKENLMLEENRTKVGELNGKIVLLTMQNKTLSEHLKEMCIRDRVTGSCIFVCILNTDFIAGVHHFFQNSQACTTNADTRFIG